MKQLIRYLSLWNTLLGSALLILLYLATLHTNEALSFSSLVTYSKSNQAFISWAPSTGSVDHYLLEITETHFLSDSSAQNVLITKKQAATVDPFYTMFCKHDHSYQIRVQGISSRGSASDFSEPSMLFICDNEKPVLRLDPLPSPPKVRSETVLITGSFIEPQLRTIRVNGNRADIDPVMKKFSATITLHRGVNQVTVHATDMAGNVSSEEQAISYEPVTLFSFPIGAKLYWNGNYAYPGILSGVTPESYNQPLEGKSFLRVTAPGFNDYCAVIDFSKNSKDAHTIILSPLLPLEFKEMRSHFFAKDSAGSYTPAHPFVVDYNLDGSKDVLMGTVEGTIICYSLSESERIPQFSEHHFLMSAGEELIDVGRHAAPFVVDYNNNGKSDLLVGNENGSILYYRNQGSNETPHFLPPEVLEDMHGVPLAVEGYSKPFMVDWDGDRRKDMLVGSSSGTISFYHNEGSDQHPLFSSPQFVTTGDKPLAVVSHASPFVADWNGDGENDLLVGDGEGYIHLYRAHTASGKPQLVKDSVVSVDGHEVIVNGYASPFLIDWNQDGAHELLVGTSRGGIYYLNRR